jgi:hypothetical protein
VSEPTPGNAAITLYMSREEKRALKQMALDQETNASELVRRMIRRELASADTEPPPADGKGEDDADE